MPVSLIEIAIDAVCAAAHVTVTLPPSGVNFTALDSRLMNTCLRARLSARKVQCLAARRARSLTLAFGGARPDQAHHLVERRVDLQRLAFQLHAARLDLRHVENVVDDIEQELAAAVDVAANIRCTCREPMRPEHLRLHHFAEADDGVERRAQLMAHVGEEFRLGAVGRLGAGLLAGILVGKVGQALRLLVGQQAFLLQVAHRHHQRRARTAAGAPPASSAP